jgi:hypothetical protein
MFLRPFFFRPFSSPIFSNLLFIQKSSECACYAGYKFYISTNVIKEIFLLGGGGGRTHMFVNLGT